MVVDSVFKRFKLEFLLIVETRVDLPTPKSPNTITLALN